MSFNPDQLWQQQGQTVQQQSQISSPGQNTSQSHGANHQQPQQNHSWSDGSSQYQSQQTWSYQTQITTPVLQSPLPVQTPQLPALALFAGQTTLQNHSHQQLHSQMHQSALDVHAQALAHHQQVQHSIAASMNSMNSVLQQTQQQSYPMMSPPVPQMQIQYQNVQLQQPLQRSHFTYQTVAPVPPTAPLAIGESIYQQYQQPGQIAQVTTQPAPEGYPRIEYMSSHPVNDATQQVPHVLRHPESQQAQPAARLQIEPSPPIGQQLPSDQLAQKPSHNQRHDNRFEALERQRNKDLQAMNREGAAIQKRLQDLEDIRARDVREREAKDAEIRRLQQEMASRERQHRKDKEDDARLRDLERSRVSAKKESEAKDRKIRVLTEQVAATERLRQQDAARNSQQMAEIVRSQATTPAVAFDMSVLQNVIEETKAQQLSSRDIERVIEDQVTKRLAGMATKADIQDAGLKMQTALSAVPQGLSEAQVQNAVKRELNNVMEDVARRVRHQRGVENQRQRQQVSQGRVQTEFVVEELPENPMGPSTSGYGCRESEQRKNVAGAASRGTSDVASRRAMSALPAIPTNPGVSSARPKQPIMTGTHKSSPDAYQLVALEGLPRRLNEPAGQISRLETMQPVIDPPSNALVRQLSQGNAQPLVIPRDQDQHIRLQSAQTQHPLNMQAGLQSPRIGPPGAQRQLEAPPLPSHDQGSIAQQVSLPVQPALRQIQTAVPQGQIEASRSAAQDHVGIGLELVRQGFEVARKTPK